MDLWHVLMTHRQGWVRLLSIVAMIATGVYLSVFRNWSWYLWAPAGALVYLILPMLWGLSQGSFKSVDIGLRPRNVFEGMEVNLYPFTQRGIEWIEKNIDHFSEPVWSQRERCLMLSEVDASSIGLPLLVQRLQNAGLNVRYYGRLKGWDGLSAWIG